MQQLTGDRWRTAYDGSSLNRGPADRRRQMIPATLPKLLAIKGFRNIHGIVTVHRFRVQGSRLRTKKGSKTQTPYNSDKKQKPRLLQKSNGVLGDLRPFLHLVQG